MKKFYILIFFLSIASLFSSCSTESLKQEMPTASGAVPSNVNVDASPSTTQEESKVFSREDAIRSISDFSQGTNSNNSIISSSSQNDITHKSGIPALTTDIMSIEPLEIAKLNTLIKNLYGNKLKEEMNLDLKDIISSYETSDARITSFIIEDINDDNENDLVIAFAYPFDKSKKESDYNSYTLKNKNELKYLMYIYSYAADSLNVLDKTLLPSLSTISVTNLIPDNKKEIFVIDKFISEYPKYAMYVMENNKLDQIDIDSIGLNSHGQFVRVSSDTIYIGSRVTDDVYSGNTFKWQDGEFISIEQHYSDNRILYKTQTRKNYFGNISTLYNFDKSIPEVKNNEVTVSNPYQLISVIGSNRTIYLEPGIYDLGYAINAINADYALNNTDKLNQNISEFIIENVENLKIIGLGEHMVEIVRRDSFMSVLKINNSENIQISNVMMGHGLDVRECVAEVLNIENSSGIKIENCSFYGCGAYGIITNKTSKMNVVDSIIEECSIGGIVIEECSDFSLINTKFYKNSGSVLIAVKNSQNIIFDGVEDNQNSTRVFENHDNSSIEIKNIKKSLQYTSNPENTENSTTTQN